MAIALNVLASHLPWTFFDRHPAGEGTPPISFVMSILPFVDEHASNGEPISAMIPVRQTVGASWRWLPRMPPRHSDQLPEEFFVDPKRALVDDTECATVSWIKPLDLFFSGEGKNRVAFLADRGIEQMPARVLPLDYPAPSRLAILEVMEGELTHTLCMLDRQLVVPVNHPSWTLPILEAYGVKREPWPKEWPSTRDVLAALRQRQPSSDYSYPLPPLDASLLPTKKEVDRPSTVQSLMNHPDIACHPKPLVVGLGVVVISMILAQSLPKHWVIGDLIIGFGAGAVSAVYACFALPIVSLRKRRQSSASQ